MKTSCPNTILLVTRDRLVRADLRAGRTIGIREIQEEHSLAVDDLPSQVEAALRLSKRRPGRVWILAGELWTQTLTLPPEALSGLSQDEITRALGFEAEPFSGLGAMEAAMAAMPLPGEGRQKLFWLTELPAAQLEQIEFFVRQSGGRLMGISHPGGLPAALDAGEDAGEENPWRRVELWPGAIVAVESSSAGTASVKVVNTEPRPGRWLNDIAPLESGAAVATHWLHATRDVAVEELPRAGRFSLEDRSTQEQFLIAWARQLAAKKVAVPRIVPPKRPMPTAVRWTISAAIGSVALAACIVAQVSENHRSERLAAETKQLQAAATQLAALKGDNDKLQAKCKEMQKSCATLKDDLEHYRQVMRAQRQRLVTLLTVLARRGQEDVLIHKIEGTENEIVLHGLCLETQFADNLAGALAEALGTEGWQVQPPTRQSKEMLVSGGPWEFEVRIQDSAAKAPPPVSRVAGPGRGAGGKQP
jgi:Tfp pilus assembly protein PilN